MRFWIALHYPHATDPGDDVDWNIYFADENARARAFARGEKVLFYETGDRPDPIVTRNGNDPHRIHRRRGRSGIVRAGVVIAPFQKVRAPFEERTGDKVIRYHWEIACESTEVKHVLPYRDLLAILIKRTFRPPNGIREISRDEFEKIISQCSHD